ncbi:unnamed protein product [Ambrosiozyma monospora]|uniref:Unnamed protein product n=1 Tax=Ambrosiozyma monospora TaxID=43982 RepID=A0A9W6YXI7_AMBMO|nr:unnamed protein product [Ambrosiozyma monospora]
MLTRESLLEITAFYYRCNYFSKPFILRSLILQERPDIAYDSEFYALELDYIRDCDVFDVIVFILESLKAQGLNVSWSLIYKVFYLLDLDGRKMLVDLLSRKQFEFNSVFKEFLLVRKKFETTKELQSYVKRQKLMITRGLTQVTVEKYLEEGLISKAWFFIKKQENENNVFISFNVGVSFLHFLKTHKLCHHILSFVNSFGKLTNNILLYYHGYKIMIEDRIEGPIYDEYWRSVTNAVLLTNNNPRFQLQMTKLLNRSLVHIGVKPFQYPFEGTEGQSQLVTKLISISKTNNGDPLFTDTIRDFRYISSIFYPTMDSEARLIDEMKQFISKGNPGKALSTVENCIHEGVAQMTDYKALLITHYFCYSYQFPIALALIDYFESKYPGIKIRERVYGQMVSALSKDYENGKKWKFLAKVLISDSRDNTFIWKPVRVKRVFALLEEEMCVPLSNLERFKFELCLHGLKFNDSVQLQLNENSANFKNCSYILRKPHKFPFVTDGELAFVSGFKDFYKRNIVETKQLPTDIEIWVQSCKILSLLNEGKLMEAWFLMKKVCLSTTLPSEIPFQVGLEFIDYFISIKNAFLIPSFAEKFTQLTSQDIRKQGYLKYMESLLKPNVTWDNHWKTVVENLLYAIDNTELRRGCIRRLRLESRRRGVDVPFLTPNLCKTAFLAESFEDAVQNMLSHLNTSCPPSDQEIDIRLKLQHLLDQNKVQQAWNFLQEQIEKGGTYIELNKITRIMKTLIKNCEFYFVIAFTNHISERYKLDVSTHSYSLVLKDLVSCYLDENWSLLVKLLYHSTSTNSILWSPSIMHQLQKLGDSNKSLKFNLKTEDPEYKDYLQNLITNLSWTQPDATGSNGIPYQQPNFVLAENTVTFQKTANQISIFQIHAVIQQGLLKQAWAKLKDNPSAITPSILSSFCRYFIEYGELYNLAALILSTMDFETKANSAIVSTSNTNPLSYKDCSNYGIDSNEPKPHTTHNLFRSLSKRNQKFLLIPCFTELISLLIGTDINSPLSSERISLLKVLRKIHPNNSVWSFERPSMRVFDAKMKNQKQIQNEKESFENFDWDNLTSSELKLKSQIEAHLRWNTGDDVEFKLEMNQPDFVTLAKLFQNKSRLTLKLSKF